MRFWPRGSLSSAGSSPCLQGEVHPVALGDPQHRTGDATGLTGPGEGPGHGRRRRCRRCRVALDTPAPGEPKCGKGTGYSQSADHLTPCDAVSYVNSIHWCRRYSTHVARPPSCAVPLAGVRGRCRTGREVNATSHRYAGAPSTSRSTAATRPSWSSPLQKPPANPASPTDTQSLIVTLTTRRSPLHAGRRRGLGRRGHRDPEVVATS